MKNNKRIFKGSVLIIIFLVIFMQINAFAEFNNAKRVCEEVKEEIKRVLIEKEPDLPDEIYTGIMFIRLDAEKLFEKGNYDKCLEKLEIVARLINVDKTVEFKFPYELIDMEG